MNFYKLLLIIVISFIFTFITYNILLNHFQYKENFFTSSEKSEINNSKNTNNTHGIQSISPNDANLPISQYVIKGSYNSAISGNYVSTEMLSYVLSRGCRFIDFEIYYIDNIPYVAVSSDPKYSYLETQNKIPLNTILKSVISYGFNTPSPNPADPLFIQLRIRSNDFNVYKTIASIINNTLSSRLYNGNIDGTTRLADIMGKIVIVMDKTTNYYYANYTSCNNDEKYCYDLTNYINIESGSEFMKKMTFTNILNRNINPPNINDNNITTDVTDIKIAYPDFDNYNISNPNAEQLIINYGCQILLYRFYNLDNELEKYEDIFRENKHAFVPLSQILINYYKKI